MPEVKGKHNARRRRRARVGARVRGTSGVPRLSVFRSNRHLWVQIIDDSRGVSLASASDLTPTSPKRRPKQPAGRRGLAEAVGRAIAARAKALGITRVRFDRGRYRYHGLVEAIAAAARKAGLEF